MKTVQMIETERLILRGIQREDAPLIVAWRSIPENYRFFRYPHALTLNEHLRWFDESYLRNDDRCDWLAFEKETMRPVGVFGLVRRENGLVETNYLLDGAAQGKGYASEAVEVLLDYAKAKWGALIAIAEIHKDNMNSIHFAERMGFAQESQSGNFIKFERKL